jgi:hypothetical protein
MAEFDYAKLVKVVKGDKTITQGKAATALGLSIGQISMVNFCKAQVEVGVYDKAPATPTSVKKLRVTEGNRWELISARTGLTISAVKKIAEDGGFLDSYTGKGRNFNGAPAAKRSTAKSSTASPKRTTAKRTTAKRSTAKRSGVGGRNTTVKRNVTGGRRSTAANPS